MKPKRPDQLWVADITYVAIATGFVYLAVILDAWSRRVVGYALGRTIEARLTLAALDVAIATRRPGKGCIRHSDRGSQYAAERYRKSWPTTASKARWAGAEIHICPGSSTRATTPDGSIHRWAIEARRNSKSNTPARWSKLRLRAVHSIGVTPPVRFQATAQLKCLFGSATTGPHLRRQDLQIVLLLRAWKAGFSISWREQIPR